MKNAWLAKSLKQDPNHICSIFNHQYYMDLSSMSIIYIYIILPYQHKAFWLSGFLHSDKTWIRLVGWTGKTRKQILIHFSSLIKTIWALKDWNVLNSLFVMKEVSEFFLWAFESFLLRRKILFISITFTSSHCVCCYYTFILLYISIIRRYFYNIIVMFFFFT